MGQFVALSIWWLTILGSTILEGSSGLLTLILYFGRGLIQRSMTGEAISVRFCLS